MFEDQLLKHLPWNSDRCAKVREHLDRACQRYVEFADENFVPRLASDDSLRFWQSISEALVAHECLEVGLPLQLSKDGPDILIERDAGKIWLEVICPEPKKVPQDWLTPALNSAGHMPHEALLLRWTAAIKEKAEKLLGNAARGKPGYLADGVVGGNEPYVVAVNGCLLRGGGFASIDGISQWPFAVEATFALGPYAVHIDRETLKQVGGGHQYRGAVINMNGAPVPADTFFDPAFRSISAIYAVDLNGGYIVDGPKPMAVIHNPFAINPVPEGLLPAQWEYFAAEIEPQQYRLDRRPGSLHQVPAAT